ncbi:AAA family ATPase [Epilithonimonas vandammei]|uniref:AAA family ATPase n=1 Tax=Epilithonimonas vandammei TaxID=2487072 RepID=UPI0028AEAE50|nr:AAA family ATPase [Epilithonimonas vandammei]
MKVQVKELGAIKEGVVDLSKKLNVFCGPNGTGKTYMAYAIYGLLKNQLIVGSDEGLVKTLIDNKNFEYKIDFERLKRYRENLANNFKEDFDSLFGIGDKLAEEYFSKTELLFLETDKEYETRIIDSAFEVNIAIRKARLNVIKNEGSDSLLLEIEENTVSNDEINSLSLLIPTALFSLLASYPVSTTYILPVERNSIFTFSKELSLSKQEAVDHFHAMTGKNKVDRFELLFKKTTRYPLAIKDGLIIADDLSEYKKNTSEYYDFAVEIENELLHGKLQITNEGELQFRPDKSPKRFLPIHMTASIIKSLASLVIYLKHIAKKNDLIIIDEPEINLHPDNQIILTRLLARLMNRGFRLLISTHSDYIVRELNNMIMLNSSKKLNDLKNLYGYQDDEFIEKDDIQVLFFDYPKKKSSNKQVTIEQLEILSSGFEIPSVNETINKQNIVAEELYYALKYSSNE